MAPKKAGKGGGQCGKGKPRGGAQPARGAGRGKGGGRSVGGQGIGPVASAGIDDVAAEPARVPGAPTRRQLQAAIDAIERDIDLQRNSLSSTASAFAFDVGDQAWVHAAHNALKAECYRSRLVELTTELMGIIEAATEHYEALPEVQHYYSCLTDPCMVQARARLAARWADIVRRRQEQQPATARLIGTDPVASGATGPAHRQDAGDDVAMDTGASASGTARSSGR